VGKGNQSKVHQMLCRLEWLMKVSVEQATADVVGLGLTVDPRVMREVRRPGLTTFQKMTPSPQRHSTEGALYIMDQQRPTASWMDSEADNDGDAAASGRSRMSLEGQGVELLPHDAARGRSQKL
jgi:hypothetical protein